MKKISFALAFFFCSGCHRAADQPTQPAKPAVPKQAANTAAASECAQKDTTTAMGTRIRYLLQDGGYKITWGDTTYQRVTDSLYTCEYVEGSGLWSYVPAYHSETKNTLVFTATFENSSGGNPSAISEIALVLPKNRQDSIYTQEFFLKAEGNYLVYCQNYFEPDKLVVQNLETKRAQRITLRPKPLLFRTPGLSINNVKIVNGSIRIIYTYDVVETHKEDDPLKDVAIEKSFQLHI